MTRRWWLLLGGGMGLLLAVAWLAWPEAPGPAAQRWVPVEPQRLEVRLGLVGKLQAGRQMILSAPFDGTLEALWAHEGQRVAAGQPLLRLATAHIDIQWRQAEAERLSAQALVDRLRTWQTSPEVARSVRALGAARSALAAGQGALDEARRLFERGIVARIEVDSLQQSLQVQREAVLDAELELQQTRARGQGEALAIAEMTLANAQARWQALTAMREQRVIKAPFAGLLTRADDSATGTARQLQAGLPVTQGLPLLILSDLEHLQVIAKVQESDLAELREGMSAQITIAGRAFSGRLRHIGQQARNDAGQGAWYDVGVDLHLPREQPKPSLRLGMSAQLAVLTHCQAHALVVPAEALQEDDAGQPYVVFRTAGDPAPRRVRVLPQRVVEQGVAVTGLQAGFVQLP